MISVIIPVFNTEKYLIKCVESVQNQTYQELQIILVDDGSTDRSGKICDDLSEKDQRIYTIHKKNGGLSSARNEGLEHATGEWISFIDSDDYIVPDMFQRIMNEAEQSKAEIIVCGLYKVNLDKKILDEYLPKKQILSKEAAHRYFCEEGKGNEYMCNKVFYKSLFDQIRFPEGRIYEDIFVLPKLLECAKSVAFLDFSGYYYLQHEETISRGLDIERQFDGLIAMQEKLDFMTRNYPQLIPKAKGEILETCCWLLYKVYKKRGSDFKKNKRRILQAFYESKKDAENQGIMLRIAIIIIPISPWLFYLLYACYQKLKYRFKQPKKIKA